mmetsp:Transcript_69257/g.202781  ORF Transcript_69257/g.202781 Transcript_69257/m.202781 type:complete len:211 (-) Transcript_69257:91-723(-)
MAELANEWKQEGLPFRARLGPLDAPAEEITLCRKRCQDVGPLVIPKDAEQVAEVREFQVAEHLLQCQVKPRVLRLVRVSCLEGSGARCDPLVRHPLRGHTAPLRREPDLVHPSMVPVGALELPHEPEVALLPALHVLAEALGAALDVLCRDAAEPQGRDELLDAVGRPGGPVERALILAVGAPLLGSLGSSPQCLLAHPADIVSEPTLGR